MKKIALLILWSLGLTGAFGQTIIELHPGGGVRGKTTDDYRRDDPAMERRLREDSLAYNDCLTRAFNALYRDSLDQAEALLEQALRLRPAAPSNYIVRHYLGRIDMSRGHFGKAAERFTALLKERPDDREVRTERATCYIEAGNPQAALQDCRTLLDAATTERTEQVRAYFLRVAAYNALHQPDLACEDLEAILRLDPDNESSLLLLPATYAQMGRPEQAMERYNLFVSSHPDNPDGYAARAELETTRDMWQAARADYDVALRLRPGDPTLLRARAAVLQHLGLNAAAEQDLRAAADAEARSSR